MRIASDNLWAVASERLLGVPIPIIVLLTGERRMRMHEEEGFSEEKKFDKKGDKQTV